MKKIMTTLAAAAMAVLGTFAQEAPAAVHQVSFAPEQGDWAIGVDLMPVFKAIGGAYDANDEVPVGGGTFVPGTFAKPAVSVMGKYMLTDRWAIKANVGVAFSDQTERCYVPDDLARNLNSLSEAQVEDRCRQTLSGVCLKAGGEYRIGKGRVQGIAGFGVVFGYSSQRLSYSYGNAITELNQNPSSNDWWYYTPQLPGSNYRTTAYNTAGPRFMAGAYASIGAEWMVTRKVALGADVSLTATGNFGGESYVTSEGWNPAYRAVETYTQRLSPGDYGFSFTTDNLGASLYVAFYF